MATGPGEGKRLAFVLTVDKKRRRQNLRENKIISLKRPESREGGVAGRQRTARALFIPDREAQRRLIQLPSRQAAQPSGCGHQAGAGGQANPRT